MWEKLEMYILNNPVYLQGVRFLQKITFLNVSLYRILRVFIQKVTQQNLHHQASAIAFSFTLSVFPSIIFLFTIIPYIPIDNLDAQIMELMKTFIPGGIYEFTETTIQDIVSRKRGDLLSFSFLFALWFATNGVSEMMTTFDTNFHYTENRNFIKKRLIALGMAFLFVTLLFVGIGVLIVGSYSLEYFFYELQVLGFTDSINTHFLYVGTVILRYLVVFLVFLVGISVIYYVAPADAEGWRFLSVGSSIAALLIILSTNGFSYYLANFASYNKLYGSIGTVLAFMIWLYLIAWILLLGFEINASIVGAKVAYEKEKELKSSLLDELSDLDFGAGKEQENDTDTKS